MSTISKLAEKLCDTEYRKAFVASQINIGIPFQIRAMLKNRPGWTQESLAQRAHMLQPRISELMTPGKTRPNIETLRRMAEAFDCGLLVRFAPFSELARWSEEFDPESFSVPSFDEDTGLIERKPHQLASVFQDTEQPELGRRRTRKVRSRGRRRARTNITAERSHHRELENKVFISGASMQYPLATAS